MGFQCPLQSLMPAQWYMCVGAVRAVRRLRGKLGGLMTPGYHKPLAVAMLDQYCCACWLPVATIL